MICIISSTNRTGSNTRKIAQHYSDLLEGQGAAYSLLDLNLLPETVAFSETYGLRSESFTKQFTNVLEEADKFVFIIPEYNGGFPGILKLFIDAIPPTLLHGKKAGLVGLSSGMTGGLRPMDQFTNVLNYLQVDVISAKPKLSQIDKSLNEEGALTDKRALDQLEAHALKMISL